MSLLRGLYGALLGWCDFWIRFLSSCITTYKKTPPPVPPRTTPSKPFISITAQSSTESAQDAYMDGGSGQRTGMTSQPGLSNSTESIDSMKALTAAIEAANAQVHGPASQHVTNSTITITATATTSAVAHVGADTKAQREALRKCLSIGIQVDPEDGGPAEEQSKFQSIGIQVEDERCHRRMTRSNSVTTAVQADLDDPIDVPVLPPRHCATMPRQHSRDAATSTVSIQGSGNHYHACAGDDLGEMGFDPSILPPPDPWMDSVPEPEMDLSETTVRSVCPRDGRWFLKLLQAETERMEGWCRQMEQDETEHELPDETNTFPMEDSIDLILQDHSSIFPTNKPHPIVSAGTGALLTGLYGVWSIFTLPGFRKIPWKLKVPYLPSCKDQTRNVMTLLEGRRGRLADLGSGDGRLVFAASSAGFQSTGFEINPILVAFARSKAFWRGVPASQVVFLKEDFWKTDLSSFNNVTAFLAPGVMELLGEKLLMELPDEARVITCRFPFPNWPQKISMGSGLNEVFAYDMRAVRSLLRSSPSTTCK